jgi:AcrR family transcriptional regulator
MSSDPSRERERRERERVDGRSLRGARNREHIIRALLELVREGELLPTAEQVSRRAGVGTRTVFRHFDDMESLYAELAQAIEREVLPLLDGPIATGNIQTRACALVQRRVEIWEKIAPFKRAGAIQRWNVAFLQRRQMEEVRRLRTDLLRWLPELSEAAEPVVEAVDLSTSFDAWNRLRVDQRLSQEGARRVLEATVLALLA